MSARRTLRFTGFAGLSSPAATATHRNGLNKAGNVPRETGIPNTCKRDQNDSSRWAPLPLMTDWRGLITTGMDVAGGYRRAGLTEKYFVWKVVSLPR